MCGRNGSHGDGSKENDDSVGGTCKKEHLPTHAASKDYFKKRVSKGIFYKRKRLVVIICEMFGSFYCIAHCTIITQILYSFCCSVLQFVILLYCIFCIFMVHSLMLSSSFITLFVVYFFYCMFFWLCDPPSV